MTPGPEILNPIQSKMVFSVTVIVSKQRALLVRMTRPPEESNESPDESVGAIVGMRVTGAEEGWKLSEVGRGVGLRVGDRVGGGDDFPTVGDGVSDWHRSSVKRSHATWMDSSKKSFACSDRVPP